MLELTVGQLFELFKVHYGVSDAEVSSVFEGQRDLLEFTMGIGRHLEQQLFAALGTGYCGTKAIRNSEEYRFKGYRKRTMHGVFGKVTVSRAHYVGPHGESWYPLDEKLPAAGHTPGLQYYVSRFTGQGAYEKALELFHEIFRPDGSQQISMRKALDMDYALGERLERLRSDEIERWREEPDELERSSPIEATMAVSVDATKLREKLGEERTSEGKKRYDIGFKDVKVGVVSSVEWNPQQAEAVCADSSYVGGVEYADTFFERLAVEMQRRTGREAPERVVFLGDGAEWIWDRVAQLSDNNSVEILDFYHASEHLSEICKELYGEHTPAYWEHYRRWRTLLYHGQVAEIIETFKQLQRSFTDQQCVRLLLREITYFEKNRSRMQYPDYRARGLPIGSGTVESACKNVIGGRMKQGGMTWSTSGADGMIQIRCSQQSNRFLSDFRQLLAAA